MLRRTVITALPAATLFTSSALLAPRAARAVAAESPVRTYALTMLDKPGLPPDFTAFPYVNPDAPKGGETTLAAIGSFDSFNPFIVRGTAAGEISRVWDTLLVADVDEVSTAYGHLAASIELPPDRTWVAFELRPEARFHDGHPVTAADVVWTFESLLKQGRPFYRAYYADVDSVIAESDRRVVFHFKTTNNRELPLILGEMAVLPKHWWEGRDFSRPLTDPPLGSGPYRVGAVDFGRSVVYQRVPEYWAANLPTARGRFNIDRIHLEYFRDATVAFEAFKAGKIDFRQENIAKQWATAYDFPALQRGLAKKEMLRQHLPTGMQGFAMNTRRPLFKDRRVRHALALAFDFEWCNINLFYNAYTRTTSYFSNSDLACSGLPAGEELALLEPFRAELPPELFIEPFRVPVTDGSGNNRDNLRAALGLLREAGYMVKDRKLVGADGAPFRFEILLSEPAFERVALPYVQWLGRLGIDAHVRTVDPAQYQRLTDAFDYDMTVAVIPETDNPGNEQLGYWSCASAAQEGSDNVMGVCSPVIDALVKLVVNAPDYDHLVPRVRALDRVLLWNWYMVPHWYLQWVRIAYWNRFGRPGKAVRTGLAFDSWWVDQTLAAATDAARRAGME